MKNGKDLNSTQLLDMTFTLVEQHYFESRKFLSLFSY